MDDPTALIPSDGATCRICRSEGTPDEPLFHPCRCSGSIRNVHQECLVEWLSHSQKKHCELCKTPFRFTKLYDVQMPAVLPWGVFIKRALIHILNGTFRAIRALLVVTIWMVILPWIIRWAWRWMFWFADAGWARDIYLRELRRTASLNNTTSANATWDSQVVKESLQDAVATQNATTPKVLYNYAVKFLVSIGIETFANTTHFQSQHPWQQSDASIFSSLSYISALTPYPPVNRILLDIFEGQLITCTVILAFILVFLIREWVVQQQPIVNLDQLREQREDAENAQRRMELLEQARRMLEELDGASAAMNEILDEQIGAAREQTEDQDGERSRPRMPERDASSRALRVQRLIEEADAVLGPEEPSTARLAFEARPRRVPTHEPEPSASASSSQPVQTDPQDLPITNAGPDARLNIRRRDVARIPAQRPNPPSQPMITTEELQNRLSELTSEDGTTHHSTEAQPDQHDESRTASVYEDSVADAPAEQAQAEPEQLVEQPVEPELTADNEEIDEESDAEVAPRPEDLLKQTAFEKFADWFFGDIQPLATPEGNPNGAAANEAAFAPIVNGVILPDDAQHHEHNHQHNHEHHQEHNHDPEVVAAAQQAGLDAEAVEDAEDIEGILELIGLQGPLAGLIQTSLFCLLLVVCTVGGAVVVPYVWGKFVIIVINDPFLLVTMLLRIVSGLGSLFIDMSILLGSFVVTIGALSVEVLLTLLGSISSKIAVDSSYIVQISKSALAEANASGGRIIGIVAGNEGVDPLDINAAVLHGSVYSHVALKELEAETNAVLGFFTSILRKTFDVLLFGRISEVGGDLLDLVKTFPGLPQQAKNLALPYVQAITDFSIGLKSGRITLPAHQKSAVFDPAMAYWSSTDRTLAVCAGYAAVFCLAAIYVAADTPITRDWQKPEKIIRNSLRQAGGVFKVILIISIEMLVFPFYCGMLLDFAFLPLFADASITSRVTFATSAPYVFCFVHWFIGTCYMFHFALFVGMCRKILRKGVLWFIRDPDDPTFHPVRDVLERNVMTQLRKIAFSALVYGALVILCLGGVIWGIGKMFSGIFPIYWSATEPTIEFPVDLLLYNLVTPLVIRMFKPSEVIHAMYAWWLRKCARMLRLSHFLFDDQKSDEEGRSNKPWASLMRFLEATSPVEPLKVTEVPADDHTDASIVKDGQYVLTPCSDQYRPPRAGEAFLYAEGNDFYIADKDGKRNESFARVYVPPLFKTRVTLFMVCLWIFSAFSGLCATLLPLVLGRLMLGAVIPSIRLNDIYAYSLGAYTLGGLGVLARKGYPLAQKIKQYLDRTSMKSLLDMTRSLAIRTAKVIYFYSFILVILPLLLGLVVETHLMMPLHTYFSVFAVKPESPFTSSNHTLEAITNGTALQQIEARQVPLAKSHTMHLVQDLALGVMIYRILVRSALADRTSRAAEVARRIGQYGRLRPDVGLTTRFVIVPGLVVACTLLLLPPGIADLVIRLVRLAGYNISDDNVTLIYRLSYPMISASLSAQFMLREVAMATTRWRARIRDEVYLVGERLHNFGEKRPPVGSRSIMRRDVTPQRA